MFIEIYNDKNEKLRTYYGYNFKLNHIDQTLEVDCAVYYYSDYNYTILKDLACLKVVIK